MLAEKPALGNCQGTSFECRLYWKLIASVQSEPHHKCHVEVAGSEEAMTALSALFHLKVGKTHCDRSALHQ